MKKFWDITLVLYSLACVVGIFYGIYDITTNGNNLILACSLSATFGMCIMANVGKDKEE